MTSDDVSFCFTVTSDVSRWERIDLTPYIEPCLSPSCSDDLSFCRALCRDLDGAADLRPRIDEKNPRP